MRDEFGYTDLGCEAATLSQCPFDVGTDEWKEWQRSFAQAQSWDTTLRAEAQKVADARIAAATGGTATNLALERVKRQLRIELDRSVFGDLDDDSPWKSIVDPDLSLPLTYEALLKSWGNLTADRNRKARITDITTT